MEHLIIMLYLSLFKSCELYKRYPENYHSLYLTSFLVYFLPPGNRKREYSEFNNYKNTLKLNVLKRD